MSDIEANKKLIRDLLEASSSGDLDRWASMFADDATCETMGNSVMSGVWTKADIVEQMRGLTQIFPTGIQITITGLTAEDDRVAMEGRGRATSVSGVPYNNTYHFLYVIRDGKVKAVREYLCTKLVDHVLASTK